jgi:single-stranded-DNA-specific exonuclease
VIAFAPGDNGEIKGSARSISGFHIRDGLDAIAARYPGMLHKFGGHAMAAGMTLDAARFADFSAAFDEQVRLQLDAGALTRRLLTDGALSAADLNIELAEVLREAGPWGQLFPEPLFDGEFGLLQQRIVGQRHLKLVLMEPATGLAIDAIWFNIDTALWPDTSVQRVRVVYRLDVNEFRGQRNLQLMVDHLEAIS